MLYDAPVARGYEVLTHTSQRRFAKNGYNQVGNTTLPTNPVGKMGVSSLYNKFLSGIAEAGYGRIYPNYGLGSPGRVRAYRPGVVRSLSGLARSGRRTLSDSRINDNPPPGTLRGLSDDPLIGPPDPNMTADATPDPSAVTVDAISPSSDFGTPVTATAQVTATPASSPGIFSAIGTDLTGVFGSLFGTALTSTAAAGSTAISKDITGSIIPSTVVKPAVVASTTAKATSTILGMSSGAVLALGGLAAFVYMKYK